jgi:predicted LPLAT superfamily acyltransferase
LRKIKDKKDSIHWADKKEVPVLSWQLRFTAFVACHFPVFLKNAFAMAITVFYFAAMKKERETSQIFLKKFSGRVSLFDSYRHFLSFSLALMEKFYYWSGKPAISQIETQQDDMGELCKQLEDGEGCLMICSHLGNIEYLWSSVAFGKTHVKRKFEIYPIADTAITPKQNYILNRGPLNFLGKIMDANSIGIEEIALLSEKLAAGNVVIVAGDRVSTNTRNRTIPVEFLGKLVHFPMGAFALGCILKVPVYFAFALRKKDFSFSASCRMYIHKANNAIEGTYLQRKHQIPSLAEEFVRLLEYYCLKHPMQWYNFYDFWTECKDGK